MIPLQGQPRWLCRDHPPSFPRAIDLRAQHMVPGLVKMAQLEKKRKKKSPKEMMLKAWGEEESASLSAGAPGRSDFAVVPPAVPAVSHHPWKPGDQAG